MLPKNLFDKYLSRFDELILRGEEIKMTKKTIPGRYVTRNSFVLGTNNSEKMPDRETIDFQELDKWKISCLIFLERIIPSNSIYQKILTEQRPHFAVDDELNYLLAALQSFKENFEKGFLEDISLQIEAEIASSYMEQAEQLLAEGQTGKYDHIPAAVLSGAVLEKELRTLCSKQTPPIPTVNNKGEKLTLNPLITELKKAGLFNELKAKQLRAWADIRNRSAHGEFDQFDRSDVEVMIKGINGFLADYLA